MEKTNIVIPIVLFLMLLGLFTLTVPQKVDQTKKGVLLFFHLISEKKATIPLKKSEVTGYRVFGLLYLIGGIIILANCRFQYETITGKDIPVWQSQKTSGTLSGTVREVVLPLMEKKKHIGLIVATIADNETDISGFGRINLASESPPNGETIFEIGSISKTFTGILLADLVAQNKIILDDSPVSFLSSASIKQKSKKESISIGHLVTHTSGLPRRAESKFNLTNIWSALIVGDSYDHYSEDMMLEAFYKRNLKSVPGEKLAYSNFGFGLLGLILSKIKGMDYQKMVETVIAHPLGQKNTGIDLNEEQQSRMATGYHNYYHIGPFRLAQLADNWNFPDSIAAAGGLRSTANDMLLFLAANMGRNKTDLTPALTDSHKILFENDTTRIGMAWFRKNLPDLNDTIIWHNGMTGGYASFLGFTENGRFGVVILSNSAKKVDYIGHKILQTLPSTHRVAGPQPNGLPPVA